LGFSPGRERQDALLDQARRLAQEIGDPALEAKVGLSGAFGLLGDSDFRQLDEAERLVELARRGDDPAIEQTAWNALAMSAIWQCAMAPVRRAQAEMQRLAGVLRTPYARYQPIRLAIAVAILEGRFDEANARVREARQIAGSAAGGTNMIQWAGTANYVVARHRGTPMRPDQTLALVERFLGYNIYRTILCGVYLSAGARNDALRELGILATDDFGRLERNNSWTAMLVMIADLAWDLDQSRYAAPLYDLLLPYAGRCPGVGPMVVCVGPVDLGLGRMALLLGRYEQAQRHLLDAIELASGMGARPYLAESRHALALLRVRRGGKGDREGALEQIDAALEIAREVGMARLIEDALALKVELVGAASSDADGRTLPAAGSPPLKSPPP
jgi:hypothetical protein